MYNNLTCNKRAKVLLFADIRKFSRIKIQFLLKLTAFLVIMFARACAYVKKIVSLHAF